MKFKVIKYLEDVVACDVLYLMYIHYDDYGYCTTYRAYVKSHVGDNIIDLGTVKIGCNSLDTQVVAGISQNGFASYSINDIMPESYFEELSNDFFSLGQSIQYYKDINKYFGGNSIDVYSKIKDLAFDFNTFNDLYSRREACLIHSLMRDIHYPNVEQFHRISIGDAELTCYNFKFSYLGNDIDFNVDPNS